MPRSASSRPRADGAGGYDSTVALDLSSTSATASRWSPGSAERSPPRGTPCARSSSGSRSTEGGRDWALERPARLVFGPRVEIDELALRAGSRSITMNGVLDRHGTSDLTLGITGLDLEALRASGLVPIGGRVDGSLHLTGPAERRGSRARWVWPSCRRGAGQIGNLGADLDWTGGGPPDRGGGEADTVAARSRSRGRCRTGSRSRRRTPPPPSGASRPRRTRSRSRCAPTASTWRCSSRCCRPRRRPASTDVSRPTRGSAAPSGRPRPPGAST